MPSNKLQDLAFFAHLLDRRLLFQNLAAAGRRDFKPSKANSKCRRGLVDDPPGGCWLFSFQLLCVGGRMNHGFEPFQLSNIFFAGSR